MAERRMFTKKITESDAFLDMPLSTQALYFHLNMSADDEGFVNNHKKIQRMIGASDDDMKLLLVKNFIIAFDSGVMVIKHWRMHNYIQSDRFHPTDYKDERALLEVKDNKAYTLGLPLLDTECIQDGYSLDTEVRLGKDRLDKDRLGKVSGGDYKGDAPASHTHFIPPCEEEVRAYCRERGNNVDASRFCAFYESKGWMVGKNKMKDWKAAVRTWEQSEKKTTYTEAVVNRMSAVEEYMREAGYDGT